MREPLDVLITLDVEVWCNGWQRLDEEFPSSFKRYVFGTSAAGDFALPKTLEILRRHGVHAVFFVEPLFAARFGLDHLKVIVDLILNAGQEVQLHLHTEWVDEIRPALLEDVVRKRQFLSDYTLAEQTALIAHGVRMLSDAGCPGIDAFRAGSFAVNADTYVALARNHLAHDSSLDPTFPKSAPDLRRADEPFPFHSRNGVSVHPLSVIRDGIGRVRHAQIGACSFEELRGGMEGAYGRGYGQFVILSHNFEMLRPGTSLPDGIVVRRFERLCGFLAQSADRFRTIGFRNACRNTDGLASVPLPTASLHATVKRYVEQAWRRL